MNKATKIVGIQANILHLGGTFFDIAKNESLSPCEKRDGLRAVLANISTAAEALVNSEELANSDDRLGIVTRVTAVFQNCADAAKDLRNPVVRVVQQEVANLSADYLAKLNA